MNPEQAQTPGPLSPSLDREFARWAKQLGVETRHHPLGLLASEVLLAHFLVADFFHSAGQGIGGVGPKDLNLLHSSVARQFVSFGGRDKWHDLFSMAATLFFGLVKNHAFHDANKRTALLVALYHLGCHHRVVAVRQAEFEALAVRVADGQMDYYPGFRDFRKRDDPEVNFIAKFFRSNTRHVDKREFRITYRQLAALLARYGFVMEISDSNKVDVFRPEPAKRHFLSWTRRESPRPIATIGFRNWGTEVSQRDIKEVRKATGLVPEAGYDTAVLMQGLSPMEALISEYSGPLKRLANK